MLYQLSTYTKRTSFISGNLDHHGSIKERLQTLFSTAQMAHSLLTTLKHPSTLEHCSITSDNRGSKNRDFWAVTIRHKAIELLLESTRYSQHYMAVLTLPYLGGCQYVIATMAFGGILVGA